MRQIAVVKPEGEFSQPLPRRRRRFRVFRVGEEGSDGGETACGAAVSGLPCGVDAEGAEARFSGRGKGWERETFGLFNRIKSPVFGGEV